MKINFNILSLVVAIVILVSAVITALITSIVNALNGDPVGLQIFALFAIVASIVRLVMHLATSYDW